jgi:GH15 family glucan-1,4-alpha-glucosidase
MDGNLSIRDFTYPHVGLLNHLSGHYVRIGVWADGQFAWLESPSWRKSLAYERDTLVTCARCTNADMQIELLVSDCVCHQVNVLLRRFEILNLADRQRDVRLFLSHNFHIAETDIGDTAFYNPFVDAVIHYKRNNYFLISGTTGDEGIFQYTTGIKGFRGAEGTWRDAEDGWLSMNPIEQGSVDSTLSFKSTIAPGDRSVIRSWTCAGHNLEEVCRYHRRVLKERFDTLMRRTSRHWSKWTRTRDEEERLRRLPDPIRDVFVRSLLIIRTQIDNGGAILAANDSDIMETARAHYSYMWPRDGALVAAVLDRLGHKEITRRFFTFCRNVLPAERPALMHKYAADGSWGATWHPWIADGQKEIPFQEDGTALVLWALWEHYKAHGEIEFLAPLYKELIVPVADFIARYRDPQSGLPLPSYDLWEERRGVHAFTCGTVWAALKAGANLARLFGDPRDAVYDTAADELKRGTETHLWDDGSGRFARRLVVLPNGAYERDMTIDSAVFALFAFGAFPATDPRIEQTMRQTLSRLWVQTEVGGMARYSRDYYFRRSEDFTRVPGNPWIICTLWAAQFYIARAGDERELDAALGLLVWAARHAGETGVLSEQLHPLTGEPLSVSPLTWSHAEFVSTTLQFLDRQDALRGV